MTINKNELLQRLMQRSEYPVEFHGVRADAAAASVDLFLLEITEAVSRGEAVQIAGFGIFEPKLQKQRKIINLSGNEQIVPAHPVVKFRAYKPLVEAVQQVTGRNV